jgi:hypothetical protein
VRYAPAEGGYIAYQQLGEGAVDLAYVTSIASNLDAWWDYCGGLPPPVGILHPAAAARPPGDRAE